MNTAPKRSMVTGGAGFIGSNLAERLLTEGFAFTVMDNLSGGSRANLAEWLRHEAFHFID